MKYSNVIIYYFSGTNNAKNTAYWFGNEVDIIGIDVNIVNIEKVVKSDIPIPDSNSLIGFISPTHGFHFPEIMRKFIKQFPESDNGNVFIMNTRAGFSIGKIVIGGISGVLHYWSSIVLMRKGYKIVGLSHVDLPSNWISVHPAIRKKGTELIYRYIEPKVRQFAIDILNGKKNYKALSISNIIADIIVSLISILYIYFGKYFFAKSYIASSDCDNCGLCERLCPVQAIKEVNGRKFWTLKCESCMKCMNNCPNKAIETAHGFIIILSILTSMIVGFLIRHLIEYPTFEKWEWLQNENIKTLIVSVVIFPFLFLGYRVMHWLIRFKLFERFFVLTSLTKYRFWGRYKAPKKIDNSNNNNNMSERIDKIIENTENIYSLTKPILFNSINQNNLKIILGGYVLERFVGNFNAIKLLLPNLKNNTEIEPAIGLILRNNLSLCKIVFKHREIANNNTDINKFYRNVFGENLHRSIKKLNIIKTPEEFQPYLEDIKKRFSFILSETKINIDKIEDEKFNRLPEVKNLKDNVGFDFLFTTYSKYEHFGLNTIMLQNEGDFEDKLERIEISIHYSLQGILYCLLMIEAQPQDFQHLLIILEQLAKNTK